MAPFLLKQSKAKRTIKNLHEKKDTIMDSAELKAINKKVYSFAIIFSICSPKPIV